MNGSWDQARKERAAALWKGGSSAREIAVELGVSRNAVIGVIHRMGVAHEGRGAPASAGGRAAPRAHRARASSPRPARALAAPAVTGGGAAAHPAPALPKRLIELGCGCCRFPVGPDTGADQLFCGAARPDGQAYCGQHHAIACRGRVDARQMMEA
jgi:GcrA cell cycle regulator